MKKILLLTIIFIMSCSTATNEEEAKTEAKELGETIDIHLGGADLIFELLVELDHLPFLNLSKMIHTILLKHQLSH